MEAELFWQRRAVIRQLISESNDLRDYKLYINDARDEFVMYWDRQLIGGGWQKVRIADGSLAILIEKAIEQIGLGRYNEACRKLGIETVLS